jgi:hypothetical protein
VAWSEDLGSTEILQRTFDVWPQRPPIIYSVETSDTRFCDALHLANDPNPAAKKLLLTVYCCHHVVGIALACGYIGREDFVDSR